MLNTPYEFGQDEAKQVVELNGQLLVAATYSVADNTIALPPRGARVIPLKTAIAANEVLIDFCEKVIEFYRPNLAHTKELDIAFTSSGLKNYQAAIKVDLAELSNFTVHLDGLVRAGARAIGPVAFPEFYLALLRTTRLFQFIEADLLGSTDQMRRSV